MNPNEKYIPIDELRNGATYLIDCRNFKYGVYNATTKGFIGIREKFTQRYLFEEFHYDTGAPFGTVCPRKYIELCPVDDIRENLTDHVEGKNVFTDNKLLFEYLERLEERLKIGRVGDAVKSATLNR